METLDYDIDRMINEGLGGGFILYYYDQEKMAPKFNKEEDDSHDGI